MTKKMEQLKKGQFYFIYDGDYEYFVVEDRTKRGLPVIEKSVDDNVGVTVEKGRIYDANGRGHVMMIILGNIILLNMFVNLLTSWTKDIEQ